VMLVVEGDHRIERRGQNRRQPRFTGAQSRFRQLPAPLRLLP
jgi:hypothetical protein